jgi:hypothetical protein
VEGRFWQFSSDGWAIAAAATSRLRPRARVKTNRPNLEGATREKREKIRRIGGPGVEKERDGGNTGELIMVSFGGMILLCCQFVFGPNLYWTQL